MNGATYRVWDKIKAIAVNGAGIYHCSDIEDIRRINELVNAGYITVSWNTSTDVAFCIAGETE